MRTEPLAASRFSPRPIENAVSSAGTTKPSPPDHGRMRMRAFASTRSRTAMPPSKASASSTAASARCGRIGSHAARSSGFCSGATASRKFRAPSLVRTSHRPAQWSA